MGSKIVVNLKEYVTALCELEEDVVIKIGGETNHLVMYNVIHDFLVTYLRYIIDQRLSDVFYSNTEDSWGKMKLYLDRFVAVNTSEAFSDIEDASQWYETVMGLTVFRMIGDGFFDTITELSDNADCSISFLEITFSEVGVRSGIIVVEEHGDIRINEWSKEHLKDGKYIEQLEECGDGLLR